MSKLTWRQLLIYAAYAFAALALVGFAFTLYQWIQNPSDGPWEPLNVLADNAFSLFNAVASFVALRSSRRASEKPVAFFSSPPEKLSEANWQRHRENTLRNIESAWIEGYLKNAVHKAVEIELGLTYQPEAVSRTWGISLKQPGQENEPIPAHKSIYKIFEENGRSLLILGEPASGKTITMLQLAESLIHKAQKNKNQPIPLVLNLSSWGASRQPLVNWLVEEIFLQYQVARGLTRAWLEHGHVLLLLDGLDEVTKVYRDDCVQAINEFKAHYAIEVVVCSRIQDYKQLSQQINLPNAILIQPLTVGEMNRYLTELGSSTSGIRAALADDKELQELAESPLLLSLMPIAYGGLERAAIATSASLETNRRRLLDVYIGRMFERRPLPVDIGYTQDQALQWLANLARGMNQHNQSDFYIERLQPTWLPSELLRQQHLMLARLVVGLVVGLVGGLVGGLAFGMIGGLVGGLAFGLISGLVVGLEIEPAEKLSWIWPDRKQIIKEAKIGLVVGLAIGLVVGLIIGLVFGLAFGLLGGLAVGLVVGLMVGLVKIVTISVQVSKTPQKVAPNQDIRNSGRNALIVTLLFWLFFGVLGGLFFWLFFGLVFGLFFGLVGGLLGGLVVGLVGGLVRIVTRYVQISKGPHQVAPNQAVRNSGRNALIMTLVFWLFFGLVVGLFFWLVVGLVFGLVFGLFGGLFGGLVAGLGFYGGTAVIQHYVLRVLLSRHNIIPFARDKHLIDYLDKMVERIFLRRVGGSWVFIHRYLLEHFASLREASAEDNMTNP